MFFIPHGEIYIRTADVFAEWTEKKCFLFLENYARVG